MSRFEITDRMLWIGIGCALATYFILRSNERPDVVEKSTAVASAEEAETQDEQQSKHPLDSLNVSSLKTLAMSSNHDISRASTQIICQQFLKDKKAVEAVLRDSLSLDPDVRYRARIATKLIEDMTGIESLHDPDGIGREAADRVSEDDRRRRREAMVYNEGGPLTQDDIFNPHDTGDLVADLPPLPAGWIMDDQLPGASF